MIESQVNKKGCFAKKKDPARSFLHALFNAHATLTTQYAELRRYGLSLSFTQAPSSNLKLSDGYGTTRSACDTAKTIMEENEDLFRITLDKVEFGAVGSIGGDGATGAVDKKRTNVSNIWIENDIIKFYLPPTLQPGFECLPVESIPEDIASPIIPLLRYIGPGHLVRLISALLCERRIILISKSITRLSVCVRAASSVLAQGLLLWRHILIPIVPPHMIRFLSVQAPYLVGILHPFASRLGKIEGLTDVLCVNLDRNQLKTLNMANPRTTVPDMLKKVGKKSSSDTLGAAECLARDLDEIVKADLTLWQQEEIKAGGFNEKGGTKENGVNPLDASESGRNITLPSEGATKQTFIHKMKNPLKMSITSAKKEKGAMSLEEKRQYETSVDAAVAFGKMIRKSFGKDGGEGLDESDNIDHDDDIENQANTVPRYVAPSHDIGVGSSGVEPSSVAENEGGEEDVRAALTCFFIHMYGDMGMYLSETHGTFWLDRRKFLLRKKQLGEKENAPTFIVLQKFSSSSMFATHVKSRIDDMSMTSRDRASIMPHHIPLFDVCTKYLAVHRLDFSLINVRRIVAKTVLACTRHLVVERHVEIRNKALSLTDDTPFNGNVSAAISELVDSCHECNTHLGVVMSVIWYRLNQTDETKKTNMHILLALHLLKNLVSHGPLTAIIEALDGAGKIYELKNYSDAKSVDHNYEVRHAADHVYSLLVDLASLFGRRRRIAFSKAHGRIVIPTNQSMWSDYLVGRLPLTVGGDKLHSLFRPEGISGEGFYHSSDAASAGDDVDDQTASLQALNKLGKSLRDSRMEATHASNEEDLLLGYEDEESQCLDESGYPVERYLHGAGGISVDPYLDQSDVSRSSRYLNASGVSRNGRYLGQSGTSRGDQYLDASGFSRNDPYLDQINEEDRSIPQAETMQPIRELRTHTLDEMEEEREAQDQFAFPEHAFASFASKNGLSVLDSFNYAVSSTGGTSQAGGSQYGSERSNSPLPTSARDTVKGMPPSMGRINEGMRDFSFPGDASLHRNSTVEKDLISSSSYQSSFVTASETDRNSTF